MAYLKDSEKSDGEGVEVGGRGPVLKVKGSSEELHAKQGKDLNIPIVFNFMGRCDKKNMTLPIMTVDTTAKIYSAECCK